MKLSKKARVRVTFLLGVLVGLVIAAIADYIHFQIGRLDHMEGYLMYLSQALRH